MAKITGTSGRDNLKGTSGDDELIGNDGNDYLRGEKGNDRLLGGRGNDGLSGGDGNDELYGGFGNDRLYGGAGKDTLQGGTGSDAFVFNEINGDVEGDVILDFKYSQGDRIVLQDLDNLLGIVQSGADVYLIIEENHWLGFDTILVKNANAGEVRLAIEEAPQFDFSEPLPDFFG